MYELTEADRRMVAVKGLGTRGGVGQGIQSVCTTEDYTLKVYLNSAKTSDLKYAYTRKNVTSGAWCLALVPPQSRHTWKHYLKHHKDAQLCHYTIMGGGQKEE